MKKIPLYQIDAFTQHAFHGNPAAICPLAGWLPDESLQAIAQENNLSETAFFVPDESPLRLRWFTPASEVDLCGHATLASAFVWFRHLRPTANEVRFTTRSGELIVRRDDERLVMDFPALPAERVEVPTLAAEALGDTPIEWHHAMDHLAVFPTEAQVRNLRPDFRRLCDLDARGLIVTAPGGDCDFVSRFFAPKELVDEDPVTGSAHCILTPYWSERLNKREFFARQVSARGGELWCTHAGDRVIIAGHAVEYLTGTINIPD